MSRCLFSLAGSILHSRPHTLLSELSIALTTEEHTAVNVPMLASAHHTALDYLLGLIVRHIAQACLVGQLPDAGAHKAEEVREMA